MISIHNRASTKPNQTEELVAEKPERNPLTFIPDSVTPTGPRFKNKHQSDKESTPCIIGRQNYDTPVLHSKENCDDSVDMTSVDKDHENDKNEINLNDSLVSSSSYSTVASTTILKKLNSELRTVEYSMGINGGTGSEELKTVVEEVSMEKSTPTKSSSKSC